MKFPFLCFGLDHGGIRIFTKKVYNEETKNITSPDRWPHDLSTGTKGLSSYFPYVLGSSKVPLPDSTTSFISLVSLGLHLRPEHLLGQTLNSRYLSRETRFLNPVVLSLSSTLSSSTPDNPLGGRRSSLCPRLPSPRS